MTNLPPLLRLLRPTHWTKNLSAFAGAIFGGRLDEPWAVWTDFGVFLVLSVASSAVYVFNDLADIEHDRAHLTKRRRPLAAGEVAPSTARLVGGLLLVLALGSSAWLGGSVLACVLAYLVLNFFYSKSLKHVVLVDVVCIALGFALRVLAGIYALGDLPTVWIILCTFFLALFLAFGKRRAELLDAEEDPQARPVLGGYDRRFLDSLLDSSATTVILTYALFTATSGKNPSLIVTVPIVYYAILHYRRMLQTTGQGAAPEQVLLHDRVIQICIGVWLATFLVISYGDLHFFRDG